MKTVWGAIRIQDWWNAILIPVIIFYLSGLIISEKKIDILYFINLLQLLFLSASTAAFGFYLNELTDIECDLKAGKKNIVSTFSNQTRMVYLITIIVLLILSSIPFWGSKLIFSLIILQIALLMIYSCPPLRWKNNPYIAVLLDSLYSGTIFYFVALVWAGVKLVPQIWIPTLIFGLSKGLRNIIYHIDKDADKDLKAGQKTMAHISHTRSLFRVQVYLMIPELISILCLIIQTSKVAIILSIIGLLNLLTKINYYTFYQKDNDDQKKMWLGEINTLYEVWIFLALLISLNIGVNWKIIGITFIGTVLFFPRVTRIFHELYLLMINTYFLGYKIFYFISDLYFIHTKPHFDIGKHWRRLIGKDAVE